MQVKSKYSVLALAAVGEYRLRSVNFADKLDRYLNLSATTFSALPETVDATQPEKLSLLSQKLNESAVPLRFIRSFVSGELSPVIYSLLISGQCDSSDEFSSHFPSSPEYWHPILPVSEEYNARLFSEVLLPYWKALLDGSNSRVTLLDAFSSGMEPKLAECVEKNVISTQKNNESVGGATESNNVETNTNSELISVARDDGFVSKTRKKKKKILSLESIIAYEPISFKREVTFYVVSIKPRRLYIESPNWGTLWIRIQYFPHASRSKSILYFPRK